MPPHWKVTVKNFEDLKPNTVYSTRVASVDKTSNGKAIHVTLEHTDECQAGRLHEVELPLPIRPRGPAADLFRPCGMEVVVNGKITPRDIVGSAVGVRFKPSGNDTYEISAFEVFNKETQDDARSV